MAFLAAANVGILLLSGVGILLRPPGGAHGVVGMNWPNAGRVYLGHFDQLSVHAAAAAVPFSQAHRNGLKEVRVFLGDDVAFRAMQKDPVAAAADLRRLADDAARSRQRLVLSNYLTRTAIAALAGHDFASDAAAQIDLTTPGSPSWRGLERWFNAVVPELAHRTAVSSWEVVNEPGFLLGVDAGNITLDAEVGFLQHFQQLLHRLGARSVNGGGRPAADLGRVTDDQIRRYASSIDVVDDHVYPDAYPNPNDALAASARWFERVRTVTGRPDLPAMLGEVGSQQETWLRTVLDGGLRQKWTVLAWGYDAYDPNAFNGTQRPDVLALLKKRS